MPTTSTISHSHNHNHHHHHHHCRHHSSTRETQPPFINHQQTPFINHQQNQNPFIKIKTEPIINHQISQKPTRNQRNPATIHQPSTNPIHQPLTKSKPIHQNKNRTYQHKIQSRQQRCFVNHGDKIKTQHR